jgi:hypothetical protein
MATQIHTRYIVEEINANAVHIWERNPADTRTLEQVLDATAQEIADLGLGTVLQIQALVLSGEVWA